MPASSNNVIFIFSQQQMEEIKKIVGKDARFGTVVVNGARRTYTDIVKSMDNLKFSDAYKLIEGDINSIKYTEP